jgi:glycosyltransferase involved in cell wall biosynthesis
MEGINLIGPLTAPMGLGVAARNTLTMLLANRRPVSAVDINLLPTRQEGDGSFAHLLANPPSAPHPLNLFHLNAQECINLLDSRPRWLDVVRHANALVPFWELPRLPLMPDWAGVLGAMDVVLAPSRFILEAIERSAPGVRVLHYPQTVFLPEGVSPNREAFGLPRDAVIFYMSFDVTSDVARKNPAAVLAAFRAAFSPSEKVCLVVKIGQTRSGYRWANAADLLAELAAMPNTIVIDQQLSYAQTLSLSASCDVYVSLHRAEGLGLNLMEAMSLGRPVIATSWSGNMDFMSPADSCLIGHDLTPVRATHYAYRPEAIGPDQVWAEPRVAEAVIWMRRLADDPLLRQQIGARAQAAMDLRRADVLAGRVLADLDAAIIRARETITPAVRRKRWRTVRASVLTRTRRLVTMMVNRLRTNVSRTRRGTSSGS